MSDLLLPQNYINDIPYVCSVSLSCWYAVYLFTPFTFNMNKTSLNVNINNESIKRINIHDYTTVAKHK